MGVHGLHTFLEEHKGRVEIQSLNSLAEAARKTAAEAKKEKVTARVGHVAGDKKQPLLLLVDGLSVLMSLAQAVPDRTHGPAFSSAEETRASLLSALLSDYATLVHHSRATAPCCARPTVVCLLNSINNGVRSLARYQVQVRV